MTVDAASGVLAISLGIVAAVGLLNKVRIEHVRAKQDADARVELLKRLDALVKKLEAKYVK